MARYRGPKTKISRIFGEPILGNGKYLTKNSNPPGQHGAQKKRKTLGEYALQLREKQKAKYTYGVLEKQFRKTFEEASRRKGVTGENMIKLLEARLDNTVFRMGIAPSRPAARQLVSHKHIEVNGDVVNVPSFQLKAGDVITIKEGSRGRTSITSTVRPKNPKFNWLDWNETELKGSLGFRPHLGRGVRKGIVDGGGYRLHVGNRPGFNPPHAHPAVVAAGFVEVFVVEEHVAVIDRPGINPRHFKLERARVNDAGERDMVAHFQFMFVSRDFSNDAGGLVFFECLVLRSRHFGFAKDGAK